jgi:hypothetical protein
MSIELIAAGFVAAYLGIAALGHVLVIAAIGKCVREDYFGGRGRKAASGRRAAAPPAPACATR